MNQVLNHSQVRVLVVDDSAFMRTALCRMIALDPDLRVVGAAASGAEALQKIPALDPQVITLDVEMPGMDGLQTLRRIMAQFPRPVIMVSSTTVKGAEITFDALAGGAFDYVPKNLSSESLEIIHIQNDLMAKIKAAAESRRTRDHSDLPRKPPLPTNVSFEEPSGSAPAIIALGTSTGGPKALQEILPYIPGDLPVPILVVLHMPVGFTAPFAERLNHLCAVPVLQASHGGLVRPGTVYLAPAGSQMTVNRLTNSRTVICLSEKTETQLHTPSVDVMMESVASAFHSQAIGVIMSGMGSDGAKGMKAIHREGGLTLGQDEASCAVYGMPRVCAEMGILDKIVPLSQIPFEILRATRYRQTSVG